MTEKRDVPTCATVLVLCALLTGCGTYWITQTIDGTQYRCEYSNHSGEGLIRCIPLSCYLKECPTRCGHD